MEQETGADGTLGIEAVGGPSGGNDDDRHGEAGYGEAEVGFFRPEPCRADEEDLQDTVDGEFADHGNGHQQRHDPACGVFEEHPASFEGRGIGACVAAASPEQECPGGTDHEDAHDGEDAPPVRKHETGLREQGDQDKARVWGQFMNGDGFAPVFGKDKRGEGCHARRKIETDTEPESYENKPRLTERVHQRHQQKDAPGDGQWDGRDLPWFEAREEKTGSGQCRTESGALHQEEARRLRVPDSQIFLNGDKQGGQRGARHVVQEKQQRNKSRPRQGCPERHGNIFRGHETLLTVISCTIAASSLKGQTADGGPGEEAP